MEALYDPGYAGSTHVYPSVLLPCMLARQCHGARQRVGEEKSQRFYQSIHLDIPGKYCLGHIWLRNLFPGTYPFLYPRIAHRSRGTHGAW